MIGGNSMEQVNSCEKEMMYATSTIDIFNGALREESKELFWKLVERWKVAYGNEVTKSMLNSIAAATRVNGIDVVNRFRLAAKSFLNAISGEELYMQQIAACIEAYGVMFKFGGRVVKNIGKAVNTPAVHTVVAKTLKVEAELLKMKEEGAGIKATKCFITNVFGLDDVGRTF